MHISKKTIPHIWFHSKENKNRAICYSDPEKTYGVSLFNQVISTFVYAIYVIMI